MLRGILSHIIITAYGVKNEQKNDEYTLGLDEAIKCRSLFSRGKYDEFEELFLQLNSDNLTQVIDCISLSFNGSKLMDYFQAGKNKNIANLILGAFYNHQAWRIRTHGYAKDVSDEQAFGFYEFQEKSSERLFAVDELTSSLFIEAQSRLIRYSTGMGRIKDAKLFYRQVMEKAPENLWAHLHYCEVIQPKWGGNLGLISDLMDEIKLKRSIIQYIVELKLLLDSFTLGENYFGGSMEDLKVLSKRRLKEIDKAVSTNPPTSIHRYILYCYLYALADDVGNTRLTIKNSKKMEGYLTLYPYGVIR